MGIDGPLNISIVTYDDSLDKEFHNDFEESFRALTLQEQDQVFTQYRPDLYKQSSELEEENPERQGMLVILQITEQLAPHIQAGEISLDETIKIEVQIGSILGSLISGKNLN